MGGLELGHNVLALRLLQTVMASKNNIFGNVAQITPAFWGTFTFFHNKIPCHTKLSESDNLEKKLLHQFGQCQKQKDASDLRSSLICKENKNCDLIIKLQINC